jgi:hypothetical protein
VDFIPDIFPSLVATLYVCRASSLVGKTMRAFTFFPYIDSMEFNTGRRYAAVLPEPVLERIITSFPLITTGIDLSCISVGSVNFIKLNDFFRLADIFIFSKLDNLNTHTIYDIKIYT